MPLLCLLVLIVTEPHPSVVCIHVCIGADAEPAPQHSKYKSKERQLISTTAVNSELILLSAACVGG